MKKSPNRQKMFLLVSALFLLPVLSCATVGRGLITYPARDSDLGTGPFTVILYSASEHNFLQTAAFLDLEGDAAQRHNRAITDVQIFDFQQRH